MKTLLDALVLGSVRTPRQAQADSLPFTVVSWVMEANPRVVARLAVQATPAARPGRPVR